MALYERRDKEKEVSKQAGVEYVDATEEALLRAAHVLKRQGFTLGPDGVWRSGKGTRARITSRMMAPTAVIEFESTPTSVEDARSEATTPSQEQAP